MNGGIGPYPGTFSAAGGRVDRSPARSACTVRETVSSLVTPGKAMPDSLRVDAVPAVGADQVAGPESVGAVRPGDVAGDRLVVLGEIGQLVPAADLHAELGGALRQHLLDTGCGTGRT